MVACVDEREGEYGSKQRNRLLTMYSFDITVVKELLGHEDIKTTMVYAKADTRLIRDAIRSFDVLEKSDYKMVTKSGRGTRKLLKKNSASATDESTTT